MKHFKILSFLAVLVIGGFVLQSAVFKVEDTSVSPTTTTASGINWYQMEDLADLQKAAPKKVIVDVYTDWCKWCKVMDEKTFSDQSLSDYLNENFYLVKLNAEQKDNIVFNGRTYGYKEGGRRGYNELAVELCQGSLSYPSFVVLGEDLKVIDVTRGFKKADQFRDFLEDVKVKS